MTHLGPVLVPDGCFSVRETCPDEDPFNCRGQMITDTAGQFSFETILPLNMDVDLFSAAPDHLAVYTVDGQLVRELVDGHREA